MTDTTTATGLFIDGEPVAATEFAWDGCHKIYLIDSPEVREKLEGYGYEPDDFRPVSELADAWEDSCSLRFICWGDLRDDDLVPQFAEEDGPVTIEYRD